MFVSCLVIAMSLKEIFNLCLLCILVLVLLQDCFNSLFVNIFYIYDTANVDEEVLIAKGTSTTTLAVR